MIKNFLGLVLIVFGIGLVSVSSQTKGKIKSISKGVLNGSAISLPKPPYPAAAAAVGASGAVNVQVFIDENGDVIFAKAVSGHPLLRESSEQAARAAKFKRTLLSGEAVKVSGVIVYNFVASSSNDSASTLKGEPVPETETGVYRSTSDSAKPGGVLNGSAINLPRPAYPPAARAVKAQGAVNVQVLLDEDGNVISAVAVSGHPLLRAAAVQAARAAKFKPTLLDGNPVKVNGIIVYNFVP